MGRVTKPLQLAVTVDVPEAAVQLLEAAGHTLWAALDIGVPDQAHAIVGSRCWRMPVDWWLKDGTLSPHAKVMIKGIQATVYPVTPKKTTTRKRGVKP